MATTQIDFGSDLAGTSDLDANGGEVSGWDCLVQALYARLITPRGALVDDPSYGFDVASMIDVAMDRRTVAMIASMIDGELVKDERVLSSKTKGEFTVDAGPVGRYTSVTTVTTAAGPFDLTLSITNVSVEILSFDQ